jgi:tyrosinase
MRTGWPVPEHDCQHGTWWVASHKSYGIQTSLTGPGFNTSYNPHCLTRDLAPPLAVQKLNASGVAYTLQASDYFEFDIRVEGGIDVPALTYHGGGHLSVGGDLGEIGNVYSSPGDPLFYLHVRHTYTIQSGYSRRTDANLPGQHANMDRLWSTWQKLGE